MRRCQDQVCCTVSFSWSSLQVIQGQVAPPHSVVVPLAVCVCACFISAQRLYPQSPDPGSVAYVRGITHTHSSQRRCSVCLCERKGGWLWTGWAHRDLFPPAEDMTGRHAFALSAALPTASASLSLSQPLSYSSHHVSLSLVHSHSSSIFSVVAFACATFHLLFECALSLLGCKVICLSSAKWIQSYSHSTVNDPTLYSMISNVKPVKCIL